MLTHKIIAWIWCLMALFLLSLTQSVAQIIPADVSRYYYAVVYGMTLIFLINLFAGRFKLKSEHFASFAGVTSEGQRAVILRILPWTGVLVLSLLMVTLDENFNYLTDGDTAGIDTIFLCANLLFSIMLLRGAFTTRAE